MPYTLWTGVHLWEITQLDDVLIGINETRLAMPAGIYTDAELCADAIAALDNCRKRYIEKMDA